MTSLVAGLSQGSDDLEEDYTEEIQVCAATAESVRRFQCRGGAITTHNYKHLADGGGDPCRGPKSKLNPSPRVHLAMGLYAVVCLHVYS